MGGPVLTPPVCAPGIPRKQVSVKMCCYPDFSAACEKLGVTSVCRNFASHVKNFTRASRYLAYDRSYHQHGNFLLLACAEYVFHVARHFPKKSFNIALISSRKGAHNLPEKIIRQLSGVFASQGVTVSRRKVSAHGQPTMEVLTSTIEVVSVEHVSDVVLTQKTFAPEIVLCYDLGFILQYSKAARNAVVKLLRRPGVACTANMEVGDVELLNLGADTQRIIAELFEFPVTMDTS